MLFGFNSPALGLTTLISMPDCHVDSAPCCCALVDLGGKLTTFGME